MLIRYPAPPGGLSRSVSLSRTGQDGDDVLLTPVPSLPPTPRQQGDVAKSPSGIDSTSPSKTGTPPAPVDPAKP